MQSFLWYLWDMVDISENMHRTDNYISQQKNGLPAIIHTIVFIMCTVAGLAAVWYFDIQSTLTGLSAVTDMIIPTLPEKVAKMSWWVVVAFTVLPTLLELFTAGVAKEDVKIMQLAIIGFTIFDAVTDIPRAYAFAMNLWPQMQLLGWGVDWLVFYVYFVFILFFATLGFEVLTCLFGYMAVCFVWKIFNGPGAYAWPGPRPTARRSRPRPSPRPSPRPQPAVAAASVGGGDGGDPEVIIIDDN